MKKLCNNVCFFLRILGTINRMNNAGYASNALKKIDHDFIKKGKKVTKEIIKFKSMLCFKVEKHNVFKNFI